MITFHQKLNMSIAEQRELERAAAEVDKLKALIEYLAIMADIEIPVEEEEDRAYGAE